MLLDFRNQWIYSPIEFCCIFSQGLTVGIKDLLEGCRSNKGGVRESAGLSEYEIFQLRSVMTVVGSVERYRHPLGPNGQ